MREKKSKARIAKASKADEDTGTARIIAHARREASKGAPLIPIEVAERIANGENAVKALRKLCGWTQAAFAQKAKIKLRHLSEIERGKAPTADALPRIAKVLGMPLDILAGL